MKKRHVEKEAEEKRKEKRKIRKCGWKIRKAEIGDRKRKTRDGGEEGEYIVNFRKRAERT